MATTVAPKPRTERARRAFGALTANPVLEDYSLRYAPRSFRRWGHYTVATSALGGIAYMADFAIGGSIMVTHGFVSGLFAILAAAVVIFLTGIPIAYYSAKYNIDMDLLTRGAGFGYFGSTLTSLIYASFTFIFFALEGSIMAQALNLALGFPLALSYLLSALIILPLVIFGMTALSKFQVWTQPIWLVLMVLPLVVLGIKDPHSFSAWTGFAGQAKHGSSFDFVGFGLGAGVALSLIAQIGEQADYLRFMPEKTAATARSWWISVMAAGPGWVVLGALKQLAGGYLAFFVFTKVGSTEAVQPIHQYIGGYGSIFSNTDVALGVATVLVILSQMKINVTNAYSGSLSWSNFFSRVLHWHPGRVVWVFFNVGIALTLMEVGVFAFLNTVLGFYSNVAIAWIGAVVADLVINKPLGLSPSYVEFKRAHLYSINPVGFGAMAVASVVSIAAFYNLFGTTVGAFSPFLALGIAMVLSPLIAIATKGRYYIAREDTLLAADPEGAAIHECVLCGGSYETPDMAACPFHEGSICSLCCSLEKECHNVCKRDADPPMLESSLPMVAAE